MQVTFSQGHFLRRQCVPGSPFRPTFREAGYETRTRARARTRAGLGLGQD